MRKIRYYHLVSLGGSAAAVDAQVAWTDEAPNDYLRINGDRIEGDDSKNTQCG
jgi:hypothetical protein